MRLTAIPPDRERNATHLSLGEVVAIVLARGVADVVERGLEPGRVALDERDAEIEQLSLLSFRLPRKSGGGGGAGVQDVAAFGAVGRGHGEGEGEKRGENEQTGCNHCEVGNESEEKRRDHG